MNYVSELEEAYTFTYPLVLMSYTAKTLPTNQLVHAHVLAGADDTSVVTLNVDTLYTQIMVDLVEGPMVLTLPDTDRFMQVQLLDAWSNTVAVLEGGGDYALVRQGDDVTLPGNVERIELPTRLAWAIGRTILFDEGDLPNVVALQDAMNYRPLDIYRMGGFYKESLDETVIDRSLVPVRAVASLAPQEFFGLANLLMVDNPPSSADADVVGRMSMIGVGPGLAFDWSIFGDGQDYAGWKGMLGQFYTDIDRDARVFAKSMGRWDYFGRPIGDFGIEYAYRAGVAVFGFGANTVDVALYPQRYVDEDGQRLVGTVDYVLHFDSFPPVLEGGFWSVTVYNNHDFLIPNPLGRYAVNDRSPFVPNDDGTVDVLLTARHLDDEAMYVLPTDVEGFHLYLRIYKPDMEAIEAWSAPTVTMREE